MINLGSTSRGGEWQEGEGKQVERARCWKRNSSWFCCSSQNISFLQLNQVVFIYLYFIPLEKRFHLSTVVSVDELSAELVFDREEREEWETSAAWSSSSFDQKLYRIDPTNATYTFRTEQLDRYTQDEWETSAAWKQPCRKELKRFSMCSAAR